MSGSGSGGDWHESLFKDQKGDSLGDGTWGKPDPNEGKLAPVAWDQLPEPMDSTARKKKRARLATPAPGSQKESGLLDIKALAPSLSEGIRDSEPDLPRTRQATPTPDVRHARLATSAKGSAGSGLIDVQELVRVQEQKEAKDRASSKDMKVIDPVAEAAIERMNSSSSISVTNGSLSPSGSSPRPQPVSDELDGEDLDAVPNRGRSMIVMMLAVLTIAVGALAYYVRSAG
jgi:hypothetical protein